MAYPKVSIIWLNHNSMKILPLVLQSLESFTSIDYPSDRFELIVVDNGSTDGSFERIREFLERRSNLRKKIIRLNKNLGFTGGNNVGFMARNRESKYVLLLNNDAVLLQHGLKTLVEYSEGFERLGGLQGVILQYGTRLIDSAGDYVDELLRPYRLGACLTP
jgi:GT2 family glycosyltransferase